VTREELTALRDAIDMALALPDSIRELLAQWLAPAAAKSNGLDPHPPSPARTPRSANARRLVEASEAKAQTAEQALLKAMKDNPNMSVVALANAAGGSRSATGERLRRLSEAGMVEKDLTGRWKLKGEEKESGPQQPSLS
jgi:hypothetical protein